MKADHRFIALEYRDFRIHWISQFISGAGSMMLIVALNWHIYLLTNSAIALGLIGLVRVIPIIIFSLIGGSFADAHNRKKVILVTQIALTITSGLLALFTFTNSITSFIIYTLAALSSVATAFELPARQAFVPSLVERKHFANATSLNVIMWQIASIAGPALAGFVIAKFGVGTVYAVNSVSYAAVIVGLFLMQASGEIEGKRTPISFHSVREGLLFVKSKTIIWSTMLLDFFSTFFASATALLPIFAKDILSVGPQGLGILYAAPAIGAMLAGFVVAHLKIRRQGVVLLLSVALYGLGTILFGFSKIFIFSFLALFVVGVGDSISMIIRNTVRQLTTPDYIRGRMTAINMIFFMGGPQLGEFEAGLLAAAVGAPLSVVVGGVATLVVVGSMAFIKQLREYTSEH